MCVYCHVADQGRFLVTPLSRHDVEPLLGKTSPEIQDDDITVLYCKTLFDTKKGGKRKTGMEGRYVLRRRHKIRILVPHFNNIVLTFILLFQVIY